MRKHLNKVVGFAVFLCPLLVSSALGAAEEGREGGGSQVLVLGFFTINFLLFALVLRRYALPVIKETLRQRRDTVVRALNEAKRAKEEAENLRRRRAGTIRSRPPVRARCPLRGSPSAPRG